MNIRKYKSSDLESCARLILNTSQKYNKEDIIPWKELDFFWFFNLDNNRDKIEDFFTNSDVLLAENDNWEIIWLLRAEGNRVKSFFVSDKYIHQWIGRALFEEYKRGVVQKWYKFIWLFSSSYWVKFYESLWFKKNWDRFLRWECIRTYPMKLIIE